MLYSSYIQAPFSLQIVKNRQVLQVYNFADVLNIFYYVRYDLKDTTKITLQDVLFLCAMGPPGGGRNDVTARFLRHYNIIGMNPFSEETMIKIFSILLTTYLRVSLT